MKIETDNLRGKDVYEYIQLFKCSQEAAAVHFNCSQSSISIALKRYCLRAGFDIPDGRCLPAIFRSGRRPQDKEKEVE